MFDVIVLGAGAAGLFAAIHAAERGRSVVVLEKSGRPGVKILMSGGTRCNITNARGFHPRELSVLSGPIDPGFATSECRGIRAIQEAFGPLGGFLAPALKALPPAQVIAMVEAEGLATKIEANGKVFPQSDRATDLLAAILRRFGRSGALLRLREPAIAVQRAETGFRVITPTETLLAARLIVAVGGQSYPGCGTTGDGYGFAREFGHSIISPRPALVPIRVKPPWVAELKGVTVPDIVARVLDENGGILADRREAALFAHFGLTGPAILDVSREVARHPDPSRLALQLDFAPSARSDQLDHQLQVQARLGKRGVLAMLSEVVPRRLAEALMTTVEVPLERLGPELSREERLRLTRAIKELRLPIAGTLGFEKAEVTLGGVSLEEVDPATLESRLQPGLHFIGEVLDLDGRIGGYNFQAAWSTGWLAGGVV